MTTIHYINHNFSDWDSQTKHMSRIERSIYLDLRTLYFSDAGANNGKIDAGDFELLCYRLSCRTDDEITALKLLLKDKFKKNGNAYRHADWDKQIKSIQWEIRKGNTGNATGNILGNTGNATGNILGNDGNATGNILGNDGNATGNTLGNTQRPLSNAERTAKTKAERKKLLSDLADLGVETPVNTPIAELRQLHEKHCITTNGNANGNDGNESGNTLGNDGNAQKPPNNHKPITNNQEPNNISSQGRASDTPNDNLGNQPKSQTTKTNKSLNVPFEVFWCEYDKKIDPKLCEPLWKKLSDQDRLDVMAYIPKYKQAQPDKQFRKNPQAFLKARSWESEIIGKTKQEFGGDNDPLAVNRQWQNNNGSQVVGGFVIPPVGSNSNVQRW